MRDDATATPSRAPTAEAPAALARGWGMVRLSAAELARFEEDGFVVIDCPWPAALTGENTVLGPRGGLSS